MEEVELVKRPEHGRFVVRSRAFFVSSGRSLRYGLDYLTVLIRSYREARS